MYRSRSKILKVPLIFSRKPLLINRNTSNIYVFGIPSSGKTTFTNQLLSNKEVIHLDNELQKMPLDKQGQINYLTIRQNHIIEGFQLNLLIENFDFSKVSIYLMRTSFLKCLFRRCLDKGFSIYTFKEMLEYYKEQNKVNRIIGVSG